MHGHEHGVQQQDGLGGFDDPVGVQFAEQPFDYPVLDPAVEMLVDRVPFAVFLRQPPPFAAVLAYVQQCVYEGDVFNLHSAALDGQHVPDFPVLLFGYFHASSMADFVRFS
ncbi:MAG: hypothetical protein FWB97_10950 [Oscillospiraceae bacterium]|nr:hypothetical protein [Oscillospiraceae bacterium]